MTLIDALETLKIKGIEELVTVNSIMPIDRYIEAEQEMALIATLKPHSRMAAGYHTLRDRYYIVETKGHCIIAERHNGFDMAKYGNYGDYSEMTKDFKLWERSHDRFVIH
ncbi:hypothetical protein LJC60_07460 [Ruminococcaceae bacterium OttesenSCG-928-D13]|nr:hypothetical protein [Ruminococcaceae bacterium OttesenSCG-928-D13]